jgi:hypothetical protein
MKPTSRKQFALVKWLDGAYKDTYTHNVDIAWILNFDPDSLPLEDSYAIEWRQPPRPSKNGWPVYNGVVIDVSRKLTACMLCCMFLLSDTSPHVYAAVAALHFVLV